MFRSVARRPFSSMVMARNLPVEWSAQDIVGNLNDKRIRKINFIKNKAGQKTGKAILHYRSQKEAELCVKSFAGKVIMDHTLHFEPYTSQSSETKSSPVKSGFQDKLSRRLYLQNLDSEVTKDDIYAMLHSFSEIQEIQLPLSSSGENLGYGIVYLSDKDHVATAINSVSNKEMYSKKILASSTLGPISSTVESRLEDKLEYVRYLKRKYSTQVDKLQVPFVHTPSLKITVEEHLKGVQRDDERSRILGQLMSFEDRTLENATELAVAEYKKIMFQE